MLLTEMHIHAEDIFSSPSSSNTSLLPFKQQRLLRSRTQLTRSHHCTVTHAQATTDVDGSTDRRLFLKLILIAHLQQPSCRVTEGFTPVYKSGTQLTAHVNAVVWSPLSCGDTRSTSVWRYRTTRGLEVEADWNYWMCPVILSSHSNRGRGKEVRTLFWTLKCKHPGTLNSHSWGMMGTHKLQPAHPPNLCHLLTFILCVPRWITSFSTPRVLF